MKRGILLGLASLFLIFCVKTAFSNEISGKVVDNAGKPLQGVQVVARGSDATAMTNEKGEFVIQIGEKVKSIVCDAPGMHKASTDFGNLNHIELIMAPINSDEFYDLSIEDLLAICTKNHN